MPQKWSKSLAKVAFIILSYFEIHFFINSSIAIKTIVTVKKPYKDLFWYHIWAERLSFPRLLISRLLFMDISYRPS